MGLENGIRIKDAKRKQLSLWPFRYPFDMDFEDGVEICYWRKCWGVRREIMLNIVGTNDSDGGDYELNVEQVKRIRKLINSYLHEPHWWEEDAYWSFDESRRMLHDDTWNLFWLKWWMRTHPKRTVFFYDSP